MNENKNEILDNGSLICENNTQNSSFFDDFDEKDVKNAKNHDSICKNNDNFTSSNSQNVLLSNTATDPVSEVNSQNFTENKDKNFSQICKNGQIDEKEQFSRLFPGVTEENVKNDQLFMLFAGKRHENESLVSLYGDFLTFISEMSKDARIKATYNNYNSLSSVGSLSSSEPYSEEYFTKEQVLRMSKAQISQNFEKIRKSQSNW